MKNLILVICLLLTTAVFAQDYNKWSIEPEVGLSKVRDVTKVGLGNAGIGFRYMATPIFGVRVSGRYTETRDAWYGTSLKFKSAQIFGVANFGRLAKLERVANNRWTILGGIGGDYTDSRDYTNRVILHRISDFHLAGFVDNEFRITNKFFLTAGLNVVTGVNSRSYPGPYADANRLNRTMTTSVVNFNVKAIFVLGKKKHHADFYLEPTPVDKHTNTVYVFEQCCEEKVEKPAPKPQFIILEPKVANEYIYFNHDSYKVDKDGLENIEQSLSKIKGKVTITAYCSNVGSDDYNKKLGLKRANAVKDKLVKLGIPANTIEVVSIGIDPAREYDMARRVAIQF